MFPLLPTALIFIAGIVTGNAFCRPLSAWILATATTLAAAFLLKQKAALQYAAVLITTFFLGAALVTHTNRQLRLQFPAGKPLSYHAVIISKPVIHGRIAACDMAIYKAEGYTLSRPVLVKAAFLRDTLQGNRHTLYAGLILKPSPSWSLHGLILQPQASIMHDGCVYTALRHVHLSCLEAGKHQHKKILLFPVCYVSG